MCKKQQDCWMLLWHISKSAQSLHTSPILWISLVTMVKQLSRVSLHKVTEFRIQKRTYWCKRDTEVTWKCSKPTHCFEWSYFVEFFLLKTLYKVQWMRWDQQIQARHLASIIPRFLCNFCCTIQYATKWINYRYNTEMKRNILT